MRAYKVFDGNWTCNGYDFKIDGEIIGTTHKHDGELRLCSSGFHFCRKLANCFDYKNFSFENKVAEIEIIGDFIGNPEDKECTSEFKIIREIEWAEVLSLCNSGDWNSGVWNSGNGNSGNRNSGDWNSGNGNSGGSNSGDGNSGDWNSGIGNSGSSNSGDWNSGNRNSGGWNSGNWNSGDGNSGDWNSGDRNSGNSNSGDGNSGKSNSGDSNSGDRNSGNWNSGDWNSGFLNTNKPDKIRVFNKWISKHEFENINFPDFFYFDLTKWVSRDTATAKEKKEYKKEIETCGGFLKTLEYKEAWKLSYSRASKEDKDRVKEIPGFDADLFYEISGIKIK